ncbi:MAG: hypothetical protein O7H41_01810 [Planctomycetota bacterium]|nr:hypothetical protein [Planctomycetota bacterium]
MQSRWRWICVFLMAVAVAGQACNKSSSSSRKKGPPPSEGATVRINGSAVTFVTVDHFYDNTFGENRIEMWNSSPAGWTIFIGNLVPDANPGCVNSCDDLVIIEVFNPLGEEFWEDFCLYDVFECFSSYSTTPGGFTTGTFWGEVENISVLRDVLNLTSGSFTAVRQ